MAGTKTITTYDGVKYQKVTLEEIGDTGHYKEISRTTESVLGILDDTELLKEATININEFRKQAGRFITLHGDGYFYLFTIIQLSTNDDFDNLAQGVLACLEKIGYVSFITYNENKIIFELIDKADESNTITLTLESYENEIYQLKE